MGQVQVQIENTSLDPDCAGKRFWYVFVMASLIIFFGGLFIICLWNFFAYIFNKLFGDKLTEYVMFFFMFETNL
jgi:hypothetical protein